MPNPKVTKRLNAYLNRAMQEAGKDMPIMVGAAFWAEMRKQFKRDIQIEEGVEYLRRGIVGKWKRRWVFLVPGSEDSSDLKLLYPRPYAEGQVVIDEIDAEWKGLLDDDEDDDMYHVEHVEGGNNDD